ncbi:MAG: hypothetical protein K2N95_12090 [Lachnospiraceae bacterium]|nr:hypothetical protein [Lachnospiraceae bacterium]
MLKQLRKKPRRSPLRLRFLYCTLEEISCAICITYFPTVPYDNKKVIFDVDGSKEYLEGKLQEEKYEVTEIEIRDGHGQVDIENGILTLTVPGHEKVGLHITAQNVYIGENYQGEFIGLRREPPNINLVVLK